MATSADGAGYGTYGIVVVTVLYWHYSSMESVHHVLKGRVVGVDEGVVRPYIRGGLYGTR